MFLRHCVAAATALAITSCSASVNEPEHKGDEEQPVAARDIRDPSRPRQMAADNTHPWRSDPLLAGRFHPEHPDDLQVIVHDGGPRFSDKSPELVWATVTGKEAGAYRAKVLNQPFAIESVQEGDEILFLVAVGAEHPVQVSAKYLAERAEWEIEPCTECGFAELFDAPSDVIRRVFGERDRGPDEELEAFTSFCPLCGGVQVVHKPRYPAAANSAAPDE